MSVQNQSKQLPSDNLEKTSILFIGKVLDNNHKDIQDNYEKTHNYLIQKGNVATEESVENLENNRGIVNESDIILLWINNSANAKSEWEKLFKIIKPDEKVDIIIICGFEENIAKISEEAMQNGILTFACPFNPEVLGAYIQSSVEKNKYQRKLAQWRIKLLECKTLEEVKKDALKHLKSEIGYTSITMALIDQRDGNRYMLDYESQLDNRVYVRKLLSPIDLSKKILGAKRPAKVDKLMQKVCDDGVYILGDLTELRKNKEHLDEIGWGNQTATDHINSWAGILLEYGTHSVGTITLDHIESGYYLNDGDKKRRLLDDYRKIIAEAIHTILVNRNQETVKKIIQSISKDLSSKILVKEIMIILKNAFNCENVTFFRVISPIENLKSEDKQMLQEWIGANDNDLNEAKNTYFGPKEGVAGWVLHDGNSRIIPHALESVEFRRTARLTGVDVSMLAVAVRSLAPDESTKEPSNNNRIIGVISCRKEEKMDFFTPYDRDLLEQVAQYTTTIIERTMILEYTQKINEEISNLVNVEASQILKSICEYALTVTTATEAVIHLLRREGSENKSANYRATGEKYWYPEGGSKHQEPRLSPNQEHGATRYILARFYGENLEKPIRSSWLSRLFTKKIIEFLLSVVQFSEQNNIVQFSEEGNIVQFSEEDNNSVFIDKHLLEDGVKHIIGVVLVINEEHLATENKADNYKNETKRVIGVLYLNKFHHGRFSIQEEFALSLFANQAANAIHNLEVLNGLKTWMNADRVLSESIKRISESDDKGELLNQIVGATIDLTKADFSYLALADDDENLHFVSVFPAYYFPALTREVEKFDPKKGNDKYPILDQVVINSEEKFKKGITGLAYIQQHSIRIHSKEERNDKPEYKHHYIDFIKETESELAVPIIIEEKNHTTGEVVKRVLGVINIESKKKGAFTETHQQNLELFAGLVAIALKKITLIEERNQQTNQLKRLQQAVKDITATPPHEMLSNAVYKTCEALSAHGVIFVPISYKKFNGESDKSNEYVINRGEIVSNLGIYQTVQSEFIRENGISVDVFKDEKNRKFPNLNDKPDGFNPKLIESGVKSAICLPLLINKGCIGVMWITFQNPQPKNKNIFDDEVILQVYANQIALAYTNAKQTTDALNKLEESQKDMTNEIVGHYEKIRKESRQYHYLSLLTSSVGVVLVLVTFGIIIFQISSDKQIDNWVVFFGLFGTLLNAIGVLTFGRSNRANQRMDNYHRELYQVRLLNILLRHSEQLDDADMEKNSKNSILQDASKKWITDNSIIGKM